MRPDPVEPEPRAFPGARLRPARGLRVALVLLAFLTALVAGVCAALPELRVIMGAFGALLVGPLGVGLYQLSRHSPRSGGRLEVGGDGIRVEGQLALPRA